MKNTQALCLALALLGLGACAKKPQIDMSPAPEITTAGSYDDADAARRAAEERAARLEAEARARRAAEEAARARAALASLIYFDYDSFEIREDSRESLDAKVPVLRSNPSVRMRIAGHTDERGSTEYNIALGMRRAQATKDYLTGFGLDASRFETFSLGEDQPIVEGTSESAWAQNRRAEFLVTGGSVAGR